MMMSFKASMLLLAKSMGVQHVEVNVELKSEIGQSNSFGSLRGGGGCGRN